MRTVPADGLHVDRQRNFSIARKCPGFLLAIDLLTFDDDFKRAALTDGQFRVDVFRAVSIDEFGHQTGGLRSIVSLPAVGDLHFHRLLLQGFGQIELVRRT